MVCEYCPIFFSVIVPSYNDGALAIEAIRSCLAQQGDVNLEVLLVDDGSTDGSLEKICSEFRGRSCVRIIRQKNAGPAVARNNGVRHASGNYLLFLDADDRIGPHYLSSVQNALLRGVEGVGCGLVVSSYSYFASDATLAKSAMKYFIAPRLISGWWRFNRFCILTGNCFPISSCLISREVFDAVGGFDGGLSHHEDWDFWIRVLGIKFNVVYTDGGYDSATYIRMRQGLMSNVKAMSQSHRQVLLRYTESWPCFTLRSRVGWFAARVIRALIIATQLLLIGKWQRRKAN